MFCWNSQVATKPNQDLNLFKPHTVLTESGRSVCVCVCVCVCGEGEILQCFKAAMRLPPLLNSTCPRLSGMSRVECWKLFNVSANTAVAIFMVNVITEDDNWTLGNFFHSMLLIPKSRSCSLKSRRENLWTRKSVNIYTTASRTA
jgi:hypothetical protein